MSTLTAEFSETFVAASTGSAIPRTGTRPFVTYSKLIPYTPTSYTSPPISAHRSNPPPSNSRPGTTRAHATEKLPIAFTSSSSISLARSGKPARRTPLTANRNARSGSATIKSAIRLRRSRANSTPSASIPARSSTLPARSHRPIHSPNATTSGISSRTNPTSASLSTSPLALTTSFTSSLNRSFTPLSTVSPPSGPRLSHTAAPNRPSSTPRCIRLLFMPAILSPSPRRAKAFLHPRFPVGTCPLTLGAP